MKIKYLSGDTFLILTRICNYTCCCIGRPITKVILVHGKIHTYIGKIVSPFNCCALGLEIYDEDDKYKYYIFGNFFQLGILCKCPC